MPNRVTRAWGNVSKNTVGLIAGVIIIVLTGTNVYFDYTTGHKVTSNATVTTGAACTVNGATARTTRSRKQVCRVVSGSLKWRDPLPYQAPTLPTFPTQPNAPTHITVPGSFYVAGACSLPHAATLGRGQWDTWINGTVKPAHPTLTGLTFDFPAGCYYIDSEGYPFGNNFDQTNALNDVVFQGAAGAKWVQTNTPDCNTGHSLFGFVNQNSHRLKLTGFEMIGTAPNLMVYCGANPGAFDVTGSAGTTGPHDVTITGNNIHNIWGDGIYVAKGDKVAITNNTITQMGRDSVSPVGGSDITITGNNMTYAAGAIVDVEANPEGVPIDRVLVASNTLDFANTHGTETSQYNGLLVNVHAANNANVADVTVRDNTSAHALQLWANTQGNGSLDGVSFFDNTSTSNAAEIHVYGPLTNGYFARNTITTGPPVGLTQIIGGVGGQTYTSNPPTMWVSPITVCGKDAFASNTYRTGGGSATAPMKAAIFGSWNNTPPPNVLGGYILPPC